jgi:hypothetical protein
VGPRAGLDDMEKRKFSTLPGLELRPLGSPASSQSLYQLRYPGSWCKMVPLNIHVGTLQFLFCYGGERLRIKAKPTMSSATIRNGMSLLLLLLLLLLSSLQSSSFTVAMSNFKPQRGLVSDGHIIGNMFSSYFTQRLFISALKWSDDRRGTSAGIKNGSIIFKIKLSPARSMVLKNQMLQICLSVSTFYMVLELY